MNKYLIIAIAVVVVALIVIVIMCAKKKKDKNNEPIHKDYDPSIEGLVKNDINNMEVSSAVTPDNKIAEPTIMNDNKSIFESQTMGNTTPVIETTTEMPAQPIASESAVLMPVKEQSPIVEPTPVVEPTIAVPTVMEPVIPTPEQNIVPEMPAQPVTSEPAVLMPVIEQSPIVEPTPVVEPIIAVPTVMEPVIPTPEQNIVPEISAQPVASEPVAVMPVVEQPVVTETPKFINVGTIAEPIVDEPVVEPTIEPVVEPTPVVESVIEPVVEEFVPEVAKTAEVQTLQNYEIKLPEEEIALEASKNMVNIPEKKAPMFVMDIPEEKPTQTVAQPEIIDIDVPDIEEIQ